MAADLCGFFSIQVTKHGLEYPHFYRRLYGLLTPEAFHVSAFQLAEQLVCQFDSNLQHSHTAA